MVRDYREKAYIRKDIILKLYEYGELNQTKLLNFCGLNMVKHKIILDDMVSKDLISKNIVPWGNKSIIMYSVTEKGRKFCEMILDAYEEMFPRSDESEKEDK